MPFEAVIILWAISGVLAYGRTLAHFQRKYAIIAEDIYHENRLFAWAMALIGPIGLFVSVALGRHGFMWRNPHNKAGKVE